MEIQIINGPNLNLIGTRETDIYGRRNFEGFLEELQHSYPDITLSCYQSNSEGRLIDCIQRTGFTASGIVLNAGGYTHTSVAMHDAIRAVPAPVVEVHISNVFAREPFRRTSLLAPACRGVISGFGLDVYRLAIEALLTLHNGTI